MLLLARRKKLSTKTRKSHNAKTKKEKLRQNQLQLPTLKYYTVPYLPLTL